MLFPITNIIRLKVLTITFWVLYCGTSWSQASSCANFPKADGNQHDICIETQGDSATPKAISVPIVKANSDSVSIAIGPLSPIESCSLTSLTSAPSTTTDQASFARLIGILLGTTIAPPPPPAGTFSGGSRTPLFIERTPPAVKDLLRASAHDFATWKSRRKAAIDSITVGQRLFTLPARRTDTGTNTDQTNLVYQLKSITDCLNEEGATCGKDPAITADTKIKYESDLQKIIPLLAALVDLFKTPPDCTKAPNKNTCEDDYANLYNYQAELAGLQNDDAKLRAGEATLSSLYGQSYKVYQHVLNINYFKATDGLFETLTITPGNDSDLTASVTCTSVLDNSTTLGPVPISLHEGIPHFIFSAGGLFVIAPTQTIGSVAVPDTSTAGFHNVVQITGSNGFQMVPFAFGTVPLWPWNQPLSNSKGITGFGVTGGIGFNPYTGIQGIDFFSGVSVRVLQKIYLHGGIHSGRFVYTDPHSQFAVGATLPAMASVPTITRFTHRMAFGASYSF
ncbi:MAG: hypothetical protein ACRD72_02055 [Candidatus Angelobacter sp.]